MKNFVLVSAWIIGLTLFTYGTFWVAKNVSYYFFYEDLVIETIKEEVKQDSLTTKKGKINGDRN